MTRVVPKQTLMTQALSMISYMKKLFASLFFLILPVTAHAGKIFTNPLNTKPSDGNPGGFLLPSDIVGMITTTLLGLVGVISVLAIIISGMRIAFARGNSEMVSKGKAGLVWAIIGLLVSFLGYLIVAFVLENFDFLVGA